ncbi:MAG: RICIN domain-containing protein, partial [Jatrophihabitantaceae bacterium]
GTCTGYYSWKGNGDYTIRNTATGYCLTTTAAAGSSRPVTAALCSGSAYQEWSFGYSGDPANQKLVFHNLGNDWYLDAEGSTVVTSAGSSGNQKVFDQCLAGAGCSPAPN